MKKILAVLTLCLLSCSNETGQQLENDSSLGILEIDAAIYEEINISGSIAEERLEYGCAKVYLQIPKQYRNSETGETITQVSHELWSVPVQKLPGNEVWTSIDTPHNTSPPESLTSDIEGGEWTYAFIMLVDGTILYDQEVRAVSTTDKWYVCENYNCSTGGCQSFDGFDSEQWMCNPSQERLLSGINFEKCPCTFNATGFPHCEFNGEE